MRQTSDFKDLFYTSTDGLRLHARVYGEGIDGPMPVVCLPGLTRNVRDFHDIAVYLSRDAARPRKVISFDYRGRGLSDHDPDPRKYEVGVELGDVLAGLAALGVARVAFIGTSRGGLITQVLAAVKPEIVGAAILNDIGPELEPQGLALIQTYLGAAPARPDSLQAAAEQQKRVHGRAFTALDQQDWLDFAQAIYRQDGGAFVPDYDPKLVDGLLALDPAQPLPTLWAQFEAMKDIPVMVIRGANSLLLSAEQVAEMARRHPGVVAVTVEGQGHAPLLHKGDLPERIAAFVAGTDGA